MGALRSDRIWLYGGLALIALLVASGWFLMINPKYAEAAEVADCPVGTIRSRVARAREDLVTAFTDQGDDTAYG